MRVARICLQVQGPMMDARLLREAVNGDEGAGVIDKVNETISTQYKLLKQKLKIPDDGSEEGSVEGSGLVKDQMRRALQFMSLSRGGAGSDGTGSEAAQAPREAAAKPERKQDAAAKKRDTNSKARVGAAESDARDGLFCDLLGDVHVENTFFLYANTFYISPLSQCV